MSKTYSAGIVTAYGAAKRAGYQGTYEDFCRQQAGYAESAATVEQAKNTAVSAANTATANAGEATTAATAAQTAKTQTEAAANQALMDISTARSGAISAVQAEGQTQTANATAQAQAAATSATTASTKASEASASATSAGQSATNAAASATSAAQSASNAQDVLDSIPADYSDLSEDVDQLKADLGKIDGYYDINTPYSFTDGYYADYLTGNLVASEAQSYTEIPIYMFRGGKIKGRTGLNPNARYGIVFYDAAGNYISGVQSTNTGHYEFDYDLDIPANAYFIRISQRIASADLWINPVFKWSEYFENVQSFATKLSNAENKLNNLFAPALRNGTALNPGNANAVTTQKILPIYRDYDYLIMRFSGNYNRAHKYGFSLTLFYGATDDLNTSDAVTNTSITKKYINNNLTESYNEPYLIVPIIDLDGYDHIALTAFRVDGNGNYVPIRVNAEQYCIVCEYAYDSTIKVADIATPTIVDGYYVRHADGLLTENENYEYAELSVVLYRGSKMSGVTADAPNSAHGIAFYDTFGNYISGAGSTNTGHYEFEYNLDVPLNASTVKITIAKSYVSGIWKEPVFNNKYVINNIQKAIEDSSSSERNVLDVETSRKVSNARHIRGNLNKSVTLLHFSDIHQDNNALNRIVYDATRMIDYIDDIICTGDMVGDQGKAISGWWNKNVLTCIGNHDSAVYSGGVWNWTGVSMATRDEYYISPFKSNWGITHTSGTSYYYKDYGTQKLRLIVLDGMLYMGANTATEATTQTAWLVNLLSDAITNGYHVLIAIHAPQNGATKKDCSFSEYGTAISWDYISCNTTNDITNAVNSAITNGLHFVGYIVGHTHQDNILDVDNNGKQLMYCVTCAIISDANSWKNSDQYRSDKQDAYNLITIDTQNTLVKIVRGGGADIDNHMRTRKAICINYSTGNVVGEVL